VTIDITVNELCENRLQKRIANPHWGGRLEIRDEEKAATIRPRPTRAKESSRRSYIVPALCSLSFLTIVDRVCISAAKGDMAGELGIADTTFGWVFGAFALGYTLMMVPSGWLVDRYGPRKMITIVVLLWSTLTAATGRVSEAAILLVVRFLFGLAEAGAFPGAARAIYNWLPAPKRGLAFGLLNTGSRLGAAFGLWGVSFSVTTWGWRFTFLLLGVVGVFWAVAWYAWFRDSPTTDHFSVEADPSDKRLKQSVPAPPPEVVDARALLFSKTAYLILFQYFASNFTFFICFSWLLPYLRTHYGMSSTTAGMYAAIPLYFGALANWVSGTCVDAIYRSRHWKFSRRLPAMCGFALAAGGVVAATWAHSAQGFIFCFAVATFGADLTLSPGWTVCADIGREHMGTLSGAMNMLGSVGALSSSVLFPLLLQVSGDIKAYFYLAALLDAAAMAGWWFVLDKSSKPATRPVCAAA
jgi:ACS family glucarate transporter-like MFS transporter